MSEKTEPNPELHDDDLSYDDNLLYPELRAVIIVVAIVASAVLIGSTVDSITNVELARAGLQECRSGSVTLWMKECPGIPKEH